MTHQRTQRGHDAAFAARPSEPPRAPHTSPASGRAHTTTESLAPSSPGHQGRQPAACPARQAAVPIRHRARTTVCLVLAHKRHGSVVPRRALHLRSPGELLRLYRSRHGSWTTFGGCRVGSLGLRQDLGRAVAVVLVSSALASAPARRRGRMQRKAKGPDYRGTGSVLHGLRKCTLWVHCCMSFALDWQRCWQASLNAATVRGARARA